jgi:hypothetical protein
LPKNHCEIQVPTILVCALYSMLFSVSYRVPLYFFYVLQRVRLLLEASLRSKKLESQHFQSVCVSTKQWCCHLAEWSRPTFKNCCREIIFSFVSLFVFQSRFGHIFLKTGFLPVETLVHKLNSLRHKTHNVSCATWA